MAHSQRGSLGDPSFLPTLRLASRDLFFAADWICLFALRQISFRLKDGGVGTVG
jgi:hypothetical protein